MVDLANLSYQTRPTIHHEDSSDEVLATLKLTAITHMEGLLNACHSALAKNQRSGTSYKQLSEMYKTILEDLNKIKNLTLIEIKQDDDSKLQYCTLSESVGGVTEKVSLVQLATAKDKLQKLTTDLPKDYQSYIDHLSEYQLKTDAIIKLPKHGKITEVQHEAVALNISRLLGFNTTQSTVVSYQDKPALFVPFEKIQLLSDFVESNVPNPKESKTSTHYSTIKAIGEKLKYDQSIEDFGKTLGFLYLCNDPDTIGGYAQNKALINSKQLYVFDQVIMTETIGKPYLSIDSRMSLFPSALIAKHSRHFRGRNRTVIEDSAFDAKFDSVVNLFKNKQAILSHIDDVINTHKENEVKIKSNMIKRQQMISSLSEKLNTLNQQRENSKTAISSDMDEDIKLLETALKDEIKQLHENQSKLDNLATLLADAFDIQQAVGSRLQNALRYLPKMNNSDLNETVLLENKDVIKHALIFEKLLNNPRLYSEDGRPYKHPWTDRNNINIINVKITKDNKVQLFFNRDLDMNYLKGLKILANIEGMKIGFNNTSIEIDRDELLKINEISPFPEMTNGFDIKKKYLDHKELNFIQQFYGEGHRTRVIKEIREYEKKIQSHELSTKEKLNAMQYAVKILYHYLTDAADKGFIKHVQVKLQLDIQQQLQKLINEPVLNAKLQEAFNAAMKLDSMAMFNEVLINAIRTNNLQNPFFTNYLDTCIRYANQADNYTEAKNASDALYQLQQTVINQCQSGQTLDATATSLSGKNTIGIMTSLTGNDAKAALTAVETDKIRTSPPKTRPMSEIQLTPKRSSAEEQNAQTNPPVLQNNKKRSL